jgi:hypothetical protein
MAPARPWTAAVAATAVLAVLAAPASGHEGSAAVIAQSVGPDDLVVERHGDPVAQFEQGSNDAAEASPVAGRLAGPEICPTVSTGIDDRVNDPHGGAPVIKVIYAYPPDVGNRLGLYGPVIQAGARAVSELVASESGGTLGVRFDIGTFEGAHCLDIQRVRLSQSSGYYESLGANGAFGGIATEVASRLGPQGGPRDYLIYADMVEVPGVAGAAEAFVDPGVGDLPEGTIQNRGGLFAELYGRGGSDFFGSATPFAAGTTSRYQVDVALHEVTHNLGGVQLSSPNSSGAGHCNDEYDLMCYEDGGPGSLFVDPNCDGDISAPSDPYGDGQEAWDCNKDDYFNTNPAPGSYLATHWNIADSAFLCIVAACSPPDLQAPNTVFDVVPKKAIRSRRAKVRFRATERSSFRCQIDGKPPRGCRSPWKVKVRRGRHKIQVTATDRSGITELSPAQTKFRVLKRR